MATRSNSPQGSGYACGVRLDDHAENQEVQGVASSGSARGSDGDDMARVTKTKLLKMKKGDAHGPSIWCLEPHAREKLLRVMRLW